MSPEMALLLLVVVAVAEVALWVSRAIDRAVTWGRP